jgi:hypothetical protein
MTDLLQHFAQDLELRGFAERSVEAYVRSVRLLAEHYNKPPDGHALQALLPSVA